MAKKSNEPSYEDALAKLESLVEAMESGEIPLADLVARFEEGSKLLQICHSRLKDAELKIEKLKESRDETAFAPFDPDTE